MKFQSTKVIDGFSSCFRQEKSAPIHCSKLHGYSLSFKVWFEGDLDSRNWIVDFGFMKRSKTKIDYQGQKYTPDEWFKFMFDHTVIVAEDDSQLEWFREAERKNILQLRILPNVGCERFAELVSNILNTFLLNEFGLDGPKIRKVECYENLKNSAIVLS